MDAENRFAVLFLLQTGARSWLRAGMTYHAVFAPANEIRAGRWDGWLEQAPSAVFQHSYAYGAAAPGRGSMHYCQIKAGSTVVAQAPLAIWRAGPLQMAILPAGLALADGYDPKAVYGALRAHRRLSVWALTAPGHALPEKPFMTGGWDGVVDLPKDAAAFPALMRQKWRNRLHKAQRSDVDIVQSGPQSEAMGWLEAREKDQRARKRYQMLPLDLPRALAAAPGKTHSFCVCACHDGHYVAAASFIVFGRAAFYFSGVSTQQGRRLSAQHLVLAAAANRLIENGISTLNLGLIDTVHAPGLARFKLGMGAMPVKRPDTYICVGRG